MSKRLLWWSGKGPWTVRSCCPPGVTKMSYATREAAEKGKALIDNCGCGSRCWGRMGHIIVGPPPEEEEGAE